VIKAHKFLADVILTESQPAREEVPQAAIPVEVTLGAGARRFMSPKTQTSS